MDLEFECSETGDPMNIPSEIDSTGQVVNIGIDDIILFEESHKKSWKALLCGRGAPKWRFTESSWLLTRRGLDSGLLRSELDKINEISSREYMKHMALVKTFTTISVLSMIVFIHMLFFTEGMTRIYIFGAMIANVFANIFSTLCVRPLDFAVQRALSAVCDHIAMTLISEYECKRIEWGIRETETKGEKVMAMDITIKCADDIMMIENPLNNMYESKTHSPTYGGGHGNDMNDNNERYVIRIDDLDADAYNGPEIQRFPDDDDSPVSTDHLQVNVSLFDVAVSPRAISPEPER